MKKLLSDLLFARDSKFNGVVAVGIISLIVLGCTCNKSFDLGNLNSDNDRTRPVSNSSSSGDDSDGTLPSEDVIQAMVRITTIEFSDAVESGDFTDFHSRTSEDFQRSHSPAKMKSAFSQFVAQKRQVVPILQKAAAMELDFSSPPSIREEGGKTVLVVDGQYPTKPMPVKVEYEYELSKGTWQLQQLIVKIEN